MLAAVVALHATSLTVLQALAMAAAAALGLALGWLRAHRRAAQVEARLQVAEQRLRSLQKDVAAMLACSRGLAERVGEQGTHLKLARSVAQAAVPLQRVEASDPQFRSARALILRGASTAEVARTCGLSHGEVELLARITPRVVD